MAYKRNNAAAEKKLKEITDRLEKGIEELFTSDRYMEYLKVMSKFHHYSMNNTVLIAMQRPDSTYVAGYNAWKQKFKRSVKAGEHGIQILVPIVKKYSYEKEKLDPVTKLPIVDENGDTIKEKHEGSTIAYRPSYVFDISQTTGEPLPTIASELKGDVTGYKKFFEAIVSVSPVPVEFEAIPYAKGYFDRNNKRIAINEGMSQQQNVKTAMHELAHAKLHDFDINTKPKEVKDKQTMEVEAESVAYTICQHYGIDTSEYSFGYVASWSSGLDLPELKASLKTIRDTAGELIDKLDEKLEEIEKEQQKENLEVQENEQAAQVREQEQLEIEKKEKVTEAVAAQAVIAPLYVRSAAYAREHGEANAWKKSFRLNTSCINDIAANAEKALREGKINEFTDKLIGDYGLDRAMYVLARNIIENKEYNLEYSNDVRKRANEFEFPEMQNQYDGSTSYLRDMDSTVVQKLFRELMVRERENERMPDKTTIEDMKDYGYTYEGMLPMQKETALELYDDDEAIFRLYPDDTESMVTDREEIENFDGMFGIEKADWIERARIEETITEQEKGAHFMEENFLKGNEDGFAIYQINSKADHTLMFASVDRIGGIDNVDKANYKVMYADTVDMNDVDIYNVLEGIYEQFNIERPEDFKGHSLSVSDIIALRKDGEIRAFYVDSFSFEEIPQFFPENRNDLVWDNDRETFLEKAQEIQATQKTQESKASPNKQKPRKGHNIQQSQSRQKQNTKSERVSVRQKLAENKAKVAKQKNGYEKPRQHNNERDRR